MKIEIQYLHTFKNKLFTTFLHEMRLLYIRTYLGNPK